MSSKVKVTLHPVANSYAAANERIIEYSSPKMGGLICFSTSDDGHITVDLYRHDAKVTINIGAGDRP